MGLGFPYNACDLGGLKVGAPTLVDVGIDPWIDGISRCLDSHCL